MKKQNTPPEKGKDVSFKIRKEYPDVDGDAKDYILELEEEGHPRIQISLLPMDTEENAYLCLAAGHGNTCLVHHEERGYIELRFTGPKGYTRRMLEGALYTLNMVEREAWG